MGEMRRRSRCVSIRLHAEIRILLYLSNPVDASDHYQQKPSGCSEQTCLCCTLWIRAYNQEFGTNWLASASNGKLCATWALPGCSFAHASEKGGRSVIDEAVVEGIEERLTRTLQSLLSEECESSDSDSDWGLESVFAPVTISKDSLLTFAESLYKRMLYHVYPPRDCEPYEDVCSGTAYRVMVVELALLVASPGMLYCLLSSTGASASGRNSLARQMCTRPKNKSWSADPFLSHAATSQTCTKNITEEPPVIPWNHRSVASVTTDRSRVTAIKLSIRQPIEHLARV
ncbi:hypothetical protein BKA82DRAFT_36008 [Pisolithus tinctorius]|uniref:Uncharacterized protein n=1 Tax=Pisolithus tinctorius Marx 270 TaxID=870435 RepID=A0A0C3MX94_PISTI|nr:hypothetical protein BKA82DRAFT_36008 [Pisolithus tinctorius]KIN93534.1 hypothetical protein M404DRAFT_36008 [Pisolithus tinctorius Marx 270]